MWVSTPCSRKIIIIFRRGERVGRYDLTMKKLFEEEQAELIRFFADIPLKNSQPLNIEFQTIQGRSSDLIFLGEMEREKIIIHFEFQSHNDPNMDYRMLRYAAEIYAKYKCPIFQEVIYVGPAPLKMPASISFNIAEHSKLDYRYKIMDLGSWSRSTLEEAAIPSLYPFLPLTDRAKRKEDPKAFLRHCVQKIITSNLPVSQRRDLLLRQELLAGHPFADIGIIEYVFKEAEHMLDLTQSAGYRRIIRKGEIRGFQKGQSAGVLAFQNALCDVLRHTFMILDPSIQLEIMQIQELEVLRDLLLVATSAKDLEEFRQALAAASNK